MIIHKLELGPIRLSRRFAMSLVHHHVYTYELRPIKANSILRDIKR